MKSAKTMQSAPKVIAFDMNEHHAQQIDAILSVTRTEQIPLIFGPGDMTPGQMIDEMIKEGNVSKVALNLNQEEF